MFTFRAAYRDVLFFVGVLLTGSLLLNLQGCKKKEDPVYTFEGIVSFPYDSQNNAQGVYVSVYTKGIKQGSYNGVFSKEGEMTTTENGIYSLALSPGRYDVFLLSFSKEGFFPHEKEVSAGLVNTEDAYEYNPELYGKSWVKISIKNISGESSFIQVTNESVNPGCNACCSNRYDFQGTSVDTTFVCPVYSGQQFKVGGYFINNNQQIPLDYSLTASFGDTTSVVIQY